jgi:hypothetical protein
MAWPDVLPCLTLLLLVAVEELTKEADLISHVNADKGARLSCVALRSRAVVVWFALALCLVYLSSNCLRGLRLPS